MTMPTVTELPRRLEPVTSDPFIEELPAGGAPGVRDSAVGRVETADLCTPLVTGATPSEPYVRSSALLDAILRSASGSARRRPSGTWNVGCHARAVGTAGHCGVLQDGS